MFEKSKQGGVISTNALKKASSAMQVPATVRYLVMFGSYGEVARAIVFSLT
jgi:hypothetical protein